MDGRGDATRLVLVGMMGAGKTTVGREVAARLGRPYVDNDEIVRQLVGMDPPALAAASGVDALHEAEVAAARIVLGRPGPLVAGLAGYVVTDQRVRNLLRERAVVAWLRARPATLRARIGEGAGRRAEARSLAWLAAIAAERDAAFAAVADRTVDVDGRTVDAIAGELVAWVAPGLAEGPAGRPR